MSPPFCSDKPLLYSYRRIRRGYYCVFGENFAKIADYAHLLGFLYSPMFERSKFYFSVKVNYARRSVLQIRPDLEGHWRQKLSSGKPNILHAAVRTSGGVLFLDFISGLCLLPFLECHANPATLLVKDCFQVGICSYCFNVVCYAGSTAAHTDVVCQNQSTRAY